jgi:hypothetical protein
LVTFDDSDPNEDLFNTLFQPEARPPKLLLADPNASEPGVGVGVKLCGVNNEFEYKNPPDPKLNAAGLRDSNMFGAGDERVEKLYVVINSPF